MTRDRVSVQTRRARPDDAEAIAAAHRDSITTIGPSFYSPDIVEAWGEGLTADIYVRAMEGGEVFFIATGEIHGQPDVLGFSSHRVDDMEDGASVYVRGRASRRGTFRWTGFGTRSGFPTGGRAKSRVSSSGALRKSGR